MSARALLTALLLLAATGCNTLASMSGGTKAPNGSKEDCANQTDDDGDGEIDCADKDCFQSPACFASCVDTCVDGATICDTGGVRTCQMQSTGCRAFGTALACGNGLLCSGGACVATCTDQCTVGAKQCSSLGGVAECKTLGSGCTDWTGPTACASGEICSGGACVSRSACSNQCTAGATRCSGPGLVQTCVSLASGCTDWTFPAACGGGLTCSATTNSCGAAPRCTAGDTRCGLTTPVVETCDATGAWVVSQSCPQACAQGACTVAAACSAGAVRCNGNNVEVCNTTGTAWLFTQACNVSCSAGACADPCTAGAKRCVGTVPETCNAGGTSWTAAAACATDCYLGDCIAADLVVDGVTKVLEGDLKFQNSVVVKNGGQLKVGPSGQLTIQAATISIDAASNISADGVGDGASQSTSVQTYSHCHSGYICCNNAYDTYTTVSCVGNQQPASCTGGNPCSGVSLVSSTRTDDVFVDEGSTYGSNKGGGAVRLIAKSVSLAGQVTANPAGTGFGGGVLIAADTISGAGAVQATGTYQGTVKLLHGSTDGFTGSITGTEVKSILPPLDVVSGSHPDSTKVYNDGLGDLYLAWSRPFPSSNGYYFTVSTSQSALPTQSAGQGTYLQGESTVVKEKDLSPGTNWFHLVSVDSTFKVGTVKSSFKVNVNATPPGVSSSSHPSQTTWYPTNAAYLSWTNPADDASFTGYYYVLDHFADTVPSASTATFTDLKQLLKANLTDGIWVFHLVSRDTRGATTKAASHTQLRIGAQPDTDNISGGVFDASNSSAPLSGVTIKVNRGLLSTSSTSSGTYTFNGQVWVGTWELRAEKDGYLPQTKTVTVVKGTPLSVNFSLTQAP